jgi:eukaryotic-like serine/threonine-protein kinase
MTGLELSHYQIDAELGRGGMGIVYRATDTKLNRQVALKVLPAAALSSPEDRARFFREAQSAAQLNHPNVCHVYEVDEAVPHVPGEEPQAGAEKRLFIAMEYMTGETLQEYVKKAPLKLAEAVSIAGQIAEALKEAHAKEIVHRDIKSANVMLTESGVAKVLDFGLAKTNQSTMLTRMGSTLGTVAYMSPEQARGEEVDGRSDLYSLGTVLYEMIAGQLPFAGDYEQAVLYSILNEPPEPLTAVRTGVPMQLEWLVEKLLSKEAEYRYQTAGDLLADLKSMDLSGSGQSRLSMSAVSAAAVATPAYQAGLPKWIWGALAVMLLLVAAGAWFLKPTAEIPSHPMFRFSFELPEDERFSSTGRKAVAISPDGTKIAYTANSRIFLRHAASLKSSVVLQGTERGREPVFSPSGDWLAFERDGEILKTRVDGGGTSRIASTPGPVYGMTWSEDHTILAGFGTLGMASVSADGGEFEYLPLPDSTGTATRYHGPQLLPGGRLVLYTKAEIDWTDADLMVLDLERDVHTMVLSGGTAGRYLPTGHLVYLSNGSLYARAFDASSGQAVSGPVVVEERVRGARGVTGSAQVSIASEGTLVKIAGESFDGFEVTLDVLGTDGTISQLTSDVKSFDDVSFSPSGRLVAVSIQDAVGDRDIWLYDTALGNGRRLASDDGVARYPVWRPDSLRVAFGLIAQGTRSYVLARTPGALSDPDTLFKWDDGMLRPSSWSLDGRTIVLGARGSLFLLDVETKFLTPFLDTGGDKGAGRLSPDNQWIAYVSTETGNAEVWVSRFPGGDSKIRISEDGGHSPEWATDGSKIYYRSDARSFLSLTFDNGVLGLPDVLAGPGISTGGRFSVSAEGTIVFENRSQDSLVGSKDPMEVVTNWISTLERVVPTSR